MPTYLLSERERRDLAERAHAAIWDAIGMDLIDAQLDIGDQVALLPSVAREYPFVPPNVGPLTIVELVGTPGGACLTLKSANGQIYKWLASSDVQKIGQQTKETVMNPSATMAATRFERLVLSLTATHGAAEAYQLAVKQDRVGADAYREQQLTPGARMQGNAPLEPTHPTIDDRAAMPVLGRIAEAHGLNLRTDLARIAKLRVDGADRAVLERYLDAGR